MGAIAGTIVVALLICSIVSQWVGERARAEIDRADDAAADAAVRHLGALPLLGERGSD
jgi:hypothetical protein